MPLPASTPRIAHDLPILRVQGLQPAAPGGGAGQEQNGASEARPLPAGSERAEGAFGVFGMMITGLIILFAVVLLFLRSRNRSSL